MKEALEIAKTKLEKGFYGFRVRKRRFTFLLMGLLVLGGIFSLYSIPKESSPDIDFGMISVTTIYQGVNPTDIDNLITDKIENAVKDIDGVKKVSSTSAIGFSNTMIELENDADVTEALVDVKDSVDKLELPSEAEDPEVMEISTDTELMYIVLLYGDADTYDQLYLTKKANKLKADLEGRGSINRIDIGGGTDGSAKIKIGGAGDSSYEIHISLDKGKVETLGLSLLQISQSIRNRNQNQPLGNHEIGELSYDFRIQGELESVEELGMVSIPTKQGFIYLKDISQIYTVLKDKKIKRLGSYELSGQNCISLSINKRGGDNLFSAASSSKALIEQELQKMAYDGLDHFVISDMAELINEDYSALAKNGLQTLIFVFLALLFFVGFKESIIATITIPLAFFVTFIVLKQLGLSLNFLTNFSLIITFGIAIDTTIVVIEGAHERLRQGFKPKRAILLAVRDYKSALITGTATTVLVFVPLLTLPGLMGKFLSFIPITIFVTLIAALIISLTLNSALYYKLSKPQKYFEDSEVDWKYMRESDQIMLREDRVGKKVKISEKKQLRTKILDKLSNGYSILIGKIMGNSKSRLAAIALSLGLFFVSMVAIAPQLGFSIFPDNDNGLMNINITTKKGTTKETMMKYIPGIEQILSDIPEIDVYRYEINGNKISANIELITESIRKQKKMRSVFHIENDLNSEFEYLRSAGLKVEVAALKSGPPGVKEVGIKLITNDNENFDTLLSVAKDFELYLRNIPGTKNVGISSEESPGQFVFDLNKNKLSILGVSPAEFYFELYAITNGIGAGSLKGKYDDHDIKIQYADFDKGLTPTQVNDLSVLTRAGALRVGDITDYSYEQAIDQITREDGNIMITVGSDVFEQNGVEPSEIQKKLTMFAKNYEYPDGISFHAGGENEENADLLQAMLSAFVFALFLIFGILVLQFNSYTQPLIIMFSILMGLFGANIGLWVTGNPYSMMFMIGFIALTGIVINDAIVFLDRANKNVERGMSEKDAIVETGKARLQPIILTTITTIVGLSSILSDAMWEPLAVTIMFGIFFGSSMTLFVIPALYYDRKKIAHLIKRTLLHPILINIGFFLAFVAIAGPFYLFGANLSGVFKKIFLSTFLVYHIAYSIYNIFALHQSGQSAIWKLLGLKLVDKAGKPLSTKKLIQRFLIKKIFLVGPAIIGIIFAIGLKAILPNHSNIIGGGISATLYLIVISYYMYQFRTGKNYQTVHDRIVGSLFE